MNRKLKYGIVNGKEVFTILGNILFFIVGFVAGWLALWKYAQWWTHKQYRVLMKKKEDAEKNREQGRD